MLKIRPEQWRSLVDDNFSRRVVESLREDAEPFCIGLTDIDLRKLVDHALAIGRDIYVTTERELAKLALINLVSRGQFIETEDFKNHIQSFGVADTEKVDRVLDAVIEALEGQS